MNIVSKVRNRLGIWSANRTLARTGVQVAGPVVLVGRPIITRHSRSSIRIGANCTLVSSPSFTALGVAHPVVLRTLIQDACISIGDDTGISGGSICSSVSVSIGKRCLFGADVSVFDTNFHPIDEVPRRYLPIPKPSPEDRVVIGDDVFIGTRAVVLPGATIGSGAVIGAGSVVRGTVEGNSIYAGNPARKIRALDISH